MAFTVQFGHDLSMKNLAHNNYKTTPMSIRNLPKVELHRHLDCSMRLSTMAELAHELKLLSDTSLQHLQDQLLILEPMQDLTAVLNKFLRAQKILSSTEVLERLAFEACEDAFNDGIRVLELRFSPTFIQDGHPELTPLKVLKAFQKGIQAATKAFPMCAGLICIFQRTLSNAVNQNVLHFVLDHQEDFIAVDLADDESQNPPVKFQSLFEEIRRHHLPITIHSGESPNPAASDFIKQAIEVLGATRIGHGVQSINDPKLLEYLKQNKIVLEVCPHSNYLTQAFPKYSDHPIRKLFDMDLNVTINSDDPGIFNTQLSDDYLICEQYHGFTITDFIKTNKTAFQASFIPPNMRIRFENEFI